MSKRKVPKHSRRARVRKSCPWAADIGGGAHELDAIIAARPFPPCTPAQIYERWKGVFPEDFWEEVRRSVRRSKIVPKLDESEG
jgi:hypothetical protein